MYLKVIHRALGSQRRMKTAIIEVITAAGDQTDTLNRIIFTFQLNIFILQS